MKGFSRFGSLFQIRLGVSFLCAGALLLLLAFFPSSKPTPRQNRPPSIETVSSNLHISLLRPAIPVTAVPIKMQTAVASNHHPPVLFSVHVVESNTVPAIFVPTGRLIQCQLVNTLESLVPNTPIIGLVTDDLWFNGDLVIPAGSEIHGQAQVDRVRERINAHGNWTVVLPAGNQLTFSGTALDREFNVDSSGWGITDGSAGIRGEVLRSDALAEVKLFLATALSGVADGLKQTQSTPFGLTFNRSARNVGQSGAGAVLDAYAKQVQDAIQRDGLYVRVSAGKQFYVYVTQMLDLGKAVPGLPQRNSSNN